MTWFSRALIFFHSSSPKQVLQIAGGDGPNHLRSRKENREDASQRQQGREQASGRAEGVRLFVSDRRQRDDGHVKRIEQVPALDQMESCGAGDEQQTRQHNADHNQTVAGIELGGHGRVANPLTPNAQVQQKPVNMRKWRV